MFICCYSVARLSLTLCDPMNCSMPVLHHLPEFVQTHVHWVGDAIQPSHPLSSPSPPALNLSQHQGLFKWDSSSHEVAKVLEFQLQHQSFQRNPRADLLQDGLLGSPCSPGDSQESSPQPQFKSINSLALSRRPTLTSVHDYWEKDSFDYVFIYLLKNGSWFVASVTWESSFLHIWKWPSGFKIQLFEPLRVYFTHTTDLVGCLWKR